MTADAAINRRALLRLALHGWHVHEATSTATRECRTVRSDHAIVSTIYCRDGRMAAEHHCNGRKFLSDSSAKLVGDDDEVVAQFNDAVLQYLRILAAQL